MRSLVGELARDKFNTDASGRAAALAVKNELFSVYDRAVVAGRNKLQVTGEGPFGPVYGNLTGDPESVGRTYCQWASAKCRKRGRVRWPVVSA